MANSVATVSFLELVLQHGASIETFLNNDRNFIAAIRDFDFTFALSTGNDDQRLVAIIAAQRVVVRPGPIPTDTLFTLQAKPGDWWKLLLETVPEPPYQSFWGVLRTFGHDPAVRVLGDVSAYCQYSLVWRLLLEGIRQTISKPTEINVEISIQTPMDDDVIVGRYVWLETPGWGRAKIYYERAGDGPQQVLFLHTAGADSRQYHDLMNNTVMRERCDMIAFDLPGHGRSTPGDLQPLRGYTNDEHRYVETIRLVIEKLNLTKVIVTGASMAGHVCLALAIACTNSEDSEVAHLWKNSILGVVPCESSAHLPDYRPAHEKAPSQMLNESLATPERTYGLASPQSPERNRRMIWWTYSSQATGVFRGDLEFYFGGWDGRGRVEKIDTTRCPVYMLTGEYDYSCTSAASMETASTIKGAKFEVMRGLGHFPASEDSERFLPYFLRALDHIQGVGSK